MIKNKVFKKISAVILSSAMILGILPSNVAKSNAEESIKSNSSEIVSFPVTLYDYNGKVFNESTSSYIKNLDGWSSKSDTEKNTALENGLYFIGKSKEHPNNDAFVKSTNNRGRWTHNQGLIDQPWNKYKEEGYQGIVDLTLDKSNNTPAFNKQNAGIFGTNSVNGKTIYNNVGLPMTYNPNTGYYNFDSKDTDVTFAGENTLMEYEPQTNNQVQFMPFGDDNFHFGLSMNVDFVKANGGKVSDGQDMIFNFSGDDDVFIFVDDQLVLDLGGIHTETSASINFATGDYEYIYTDLNLEVCGQKSGTSDYIKNLADGNHTLRIYYLERGAGMSNCRISFNLLRQDQLKISKELGQDTNTNEDFTFKVTKDNQAYAQKEYQVLDSNGVVQGNILTTNDNGELKLKAGQTAKFVASPDLGQYKIKEIVSSGIDYRTEWTVSKNNNILGSTKIGKESDTISVSYQPGQNSANIYHVKCKNTKVEDPELIEDVVVLDYGKKVDIDVTKNDDIQNTLVAVGNNTSPTTDSTELDRSYYKETEKVELTYGNIVRKDSNTLTYEMNTFMDGIDRAKYAVTSTSGDGEPKYLYGSLKIIPATTVYYEDNFAGSSPTNSTGTIVFSGSATTVSGSDTTVGTLINKDTQSQDNNSYGYDSSYSQDSGFSYGTATKVEASTTNAETITFSFKGKGFDIISKTDTSTGLVLMRVYKGNSVTGTPLYSKVLDTVYEDGNLYQIPVFNWSTSDYGQYTVEITIGKGQIFYLDGIRIYNPINSNDETEANEAYKEAGEAYEQIKEIRKELLSSGTLFYNNSEKGIVYVDTEQEGVGINTYLEKGPNNEVYLKPNQAIGFKLVLPAKPVSIQLGAKSPNGNASLQVTNNIGTKPYNLNLETATSMYYSLGEQIGVDNNGLVNVSPNGDGTYSVEIYITNSGTNTSEIISLSNLKVTYKEQTTQWYFESNPSIVDNTRLIASGKNINFNNLEIKKAGFSSKNVKLNKYATLNVSTNLDVADIVVLNEKGNKVKVDSVKSSVSKVRNEKTFTIKLKLNTLGKNTYKVYAVDKKGNISNEYKSASINVKK